MVTPVAEYSHALGCAVTGGYVYRGMQSPALAGAYFFGDYCSGRIWGLWHLGPNQWHMAEIADTAINIASFGEDVAGELYVVGSGAIYHIRQSGGQLYFPAVMENAAGR